MRSRRAQLRRGGHAVVCQRLQDLLSASSLRDPCIRLTVLASRKTRLCSTSASSAILYDNAQTGTNWSTPRSEMLPLSTAFVPSKEVRMKVIHYLGASTPIATAALRVTVHCMNFNKTLRACAWHRRASGPY